MEKDNSFVLLAHQVPDILHLLTFHDKWTAAILDVDVEMTSKREKNHIRGFAMQQFGNDSSIVLLAHLTQAILLFMFFLNCGRAPS